MTPIAADSHHGLTAASLQELLRLGEKARQLRLAPQVARARQAGQYLSRLRGRGMEFDESRPYQPGDDVRNMDWRVTARIGKPFSKLYREERERPVLISVDARAAMFFATRGRFKWVQAQRAAALLAWAAFQGGDRVGGEIFSERKHLELRPRRGKSALSKFLKALADMPASAATPSVTLLQPLRRLRHIAHPGSLVALVSDFRGLDERAERELVEIARHNDVPLLHLFDRLERELPPPGLYRVGDGEQTLMLDTTQRASLQAHHQRFQARVTRLEALCRRHRMTWLQCATDQDVVAVLTDAFGKRRG